MFFDSLFASKMSFSIVASFLQISPVQVFFDVRFRDINVALGNDFVGNSSFTR